MKYGPDKIEFMESLDRPPKALQERPELRSYLYPIWEAFWFLHPSRPVGMSAGAIPVTEMIAYFKMTGLVVDLADKVYLVRMVDVAYLEWLEKQHGV